MTIGQILRRIELKEAITCSELLRLERRRMKLVSELERLHRLLPDCYTTCEKGWRLPNPHRVVE